MVNEHFGRTQSELDLYSLSKSLLIALEELLLLPYFVVDDDDPDPMLAVDETMREWQAYDSTDLLRWAERNRGKAIVYDTTDDGSLIRSSSKESNCMISQNVVNELATLLVQTEESNRRKVANTKKEVMDEWYLLYCNHESLVGHLVLCHRYDEKFFKEYDIDTDVDNLLEMHSKIHEQMREKDKTKL